MNECLTTHQLKYKFLQDVFFLLCRIFLRALALSMQYASRLSLDPWLVDVCTSRGSCFVL